MEGQNAGVNTEEGIPTQHFDVPIFEVECVMVPYGRGTDGKLCIRGVRCCEVRYSSNADGWGLCNRGCGDRFRLPYGY